MYLSVPAELHMKSQQGQAFDFSSMSRGYEQIAHQRTVSMSNLRNPYEQLLLSITTFAAMSPSKEHP